MDQADFVHLVRMSEHASADNSRAYRRSVAAFAALGYAWVLGCLGLAAAIVLWVVPQLLQGRFRLVLVLLLISAAGLLWVSLRALWVRFDAPQGVELTALEAPELFEALARIRRKIKGPPLHKVLLNAEFNASIEQVPRYGLLGGAVNHLTIGLPLMMALDRPRFLAVLAHEYGHLRGDHGRFAAWIYRTRLSWMRLNHSLADDQGPAAAATQAFMRWYFPRFSAKTFALARQDEYEADRIAGKLLGREVAAAALAEIEIRGAWLASEFWRDHWCAAAGNPLPVGPYRSMRRRLAQPPDAAFANDALRQALKRLSDVDDTHPGLRDRIEALDAIPTVPDWSRGTALALLGDEAKRWVKHFDKQWCRDNATEWKQHHAWLGRVRARAEALEAAAAQASAADLVELARLKRHLDPHASVRALYDMALERSPDHPGALRGLVPCLPEDDRDGKLALLHRLWDAGSNDRYWAARAALAELETPRLGMEHDAAAFKQWRKRLERAQESEERAWDELSGTSFFSQIARHDLNPFELAELQSELARCAPVARCWLVRKHLREHPQRRAYLLFVELPGMDDGGRYALCRSLERHLSIPGPALALWAGESPTLKEIQRYAFDPVFTR
ncbi:M48 family metallopeptidase [Paracidovorax sp. MALMAid1276]|uniref:M48 family metallopeptidase n=1 Tax=Paracidovorax sp. MALMAid1276 TaxID=3411631 RepID=UPI003B9C56E0